MKTEFYKDLQNNFITIRHLHSSISVDKSLLDTTLNSIKNARECINLSLDSAEKEVLFYCIDTLLEIINEGNNEKIFDYADAIHNIPEIYMQKRDIYSFNIEIETFRKKYGKHYFPFIL